MDRGIVDVVNQTNRCDDGSPDNETFAMLPPQQHNTPMCLLFNETESETIGNAYVEQNNHRKVRLGSFVTVCYICYTRIVVLVLCLVWWAFSHVLFLFLYDESSRVLSLFVHTFWVFGSMGYVCLCRVFDFRSLVWVMGIRFFHLPTQQKDGHQTTYI